MVGAEMKCKMLCAGAAGWLQRAVVPTDEDVLWQQGPASFIDVCLWAGDAVPLT
jgi:hypothetical protein